ncbi:GNAT family N-acetyltransferase [Mesorhizobium sp. 1B3]|uniref:GNAT family N-acetyltransferase n=1 Tax=Mesorhizobium sp. 1B3 TaxID=3243599 RepID=UPI003D988D8F
MRDARLQVEFIDNGKALQALARQWWDLWGRSPAATPFLTPAWMLPWWQQFAPGHLRTVAVLRGSHLVGLAPLYLEQDGVRARLMPLGIPVSDYLDVLVDPSCQGESAALLMDSILALRWDRFELEELLEEATAWNLPCPSAASSETGRQGRCPVLYLDCAEDLEGAVPSRRRRQLRRALRAAKRRGETAIQRAECSPRDFLDHLFRLHRACWERRGEGGVLWDPAVQAFHRKALPGLAKAGLARCYLVRIDDAVVGAYYGFLSGSKAYAYIGGFDPDFAEESPGSILIGHALAEAVREGATEFHFLRGGEAYKYSWGAVDRWNRRRTFIRLAP